LRAAILVLKKPIYSFSLFFNEEYMEEFNELLGLYENSVIEFQKANVAGADDEFYSAFLKYKKCTEDLCNFVKENLNNG